ncbi:hypothetical protein [Lacisediminihabitans changchengi]|uniref:Uncharacterized protein n=1 Tax=Lacisediminihabitans changchengi TaxID=2787634 RepID=A0A934SK56_9MICO|nr:hypothetical protein [Lacisediminihabitans changchengi]MBK4347068.1 hypothetical protein [Lacisediminihabitans changchengi]MBK4347809.1 hypothetical protein [Lacisediminihabitans changchengi]
MMRPLIPGDEVVASGILFQFDATYWLLLNDERYQYPVVGAPSESETVQLQIPPDSASEWVRNLGALMTVRGVWDGRSLDVPTGPLSPASFDWETTAIAYEEASPPTTTSRPAPSSPALIQAAQELYASGDLLELSSESEQALVYATSTNDRAVEIALRPHFGDRLHVVSSRMAHADVMRLRDIIYTLPDELLSSFGQQASPAHQVQIVATVKWVPESLADALSAFPPDSYELRALLTPA